ncbi:MAG: hypothetical protein Q8L55_14870 [Phycisphaerales bacterium]|nr:hypothetical protein [Phycisphaerales bacterium]
MKKKFALSLLLAAALSSGSCQYVDVTKTGKEVFPATRADDVEILTVVPRDRSFTEIATISTRDWDPGDTAKMHNALREKAAPLGAQAVVLSNSGVNPNGWLWATGTAIRYK